MKRFLRLSLLLAFFAVKTCALVGVVQAAQPLGTAALADSGGTCPGGLATTRCMLATVSCTGVTTLTASIKQTDPGGAVTGTMVAFVGGDGTGYWEAYTQGTAGVLQPALDRGWRVLQVSWTAPGVWSGSTSGSSYGGDSVPDGPRGRACLPATLIRAISDDARLRNPAQPLIAVGQSGGATQVIYSLTHYGLGDQVDCAVVSGGPAFGLLEQGCRNATWPAWVTECTPLLNAPGDTCGHDAASALFVDTTWNDGGTQCAAKTRRADWATHSIVASGTELSFAKTRLSFVLGGAEVGEPVPIGKAVANRLSGFGGTSITTVGGVTHIVPDFVDGAAAINTRLAACTYLHTAADIEPDPLPTTAGLASGTTNEVSLGDWTAVDGSAAFSCVFEFKQPSAGCNAAGTNRPFLNRNTASNRQFAFECVNNALTIAVGDGTNIFRKSTTNNYMPSRVLVTRAYMGFDGAAAEESRPWLCVTDEHHGRECPTLTDSGATIPATLPTVTGNVLLMPSASNLTIDWIDNVACWFDYSLTVQDRCCLDGGVWTGGVCCDPSSPTSACYDPALTASTIGELRNPLTASCLAQPADVFYSVGEGGDSSAKILNRASPGTFDGAPSDGSAAFVLGTTKTNRLPFPTLRGFDNSQPRLFEDSRFVDWSFRWGRGYASREGEGLYGYLMQPKIYRKSLDTIYMQWNGGTAHGQETHHIRSTISRDRGRTWAISGQVDWPYTTGVETYVDHTITALAGPGGNGNRGSAAIVKATRGGGMPQGSVLVCWNFVPNSGTPPNRYVRCMTATDWHVDSPSFSLITDPFNSGRGTDWDSHGAYPILETFAGNLIQPMYHHNVAAVTYFDELHRCDHADDCRVPANFNEHFDLEDGADTSPTYQPEEPACGMLFGGDHHGELLCGVRSDSQPPGGYQAGEISFTTIVDPDAVTPTVTTVTGAPAGSHFNWSVTNAVNGINTPVWIQLDNGTLVLATRCEHEGDGYELCVYESTSWTGGAPAWSLVGMLTKNLSEVARNVNIVGMLQVEPNVVMIAYTYELEENVNMCTGVVAQLRRDTFTDGARPMGWKNDGACRLNDGGATNEQIVIGPLRVLYGKARAAWGVSFHSASLGGPASIWGQWGATDGEQLFEIEADSNERLRVRIANGGTDYVWTSNNGVWTAGAWNHLLVAFNAGVLTVYANGTALSPASTSGSLPAVLNTASGSEARLGMRYDGTQPLTGYVDEIIEWEGSVVTTSLGTNWTAGAVRYDPRQSAIDVPMGYWGCEGSAGSDMKDSTANLRILNYGYAYEKPRADCLNCEAADIGAAIP